MSAFAPARSGALNALYRKLNGRLLPLLFICYVFAYLDRINVGFAKLQMQSDLGLSDAAYGAGAGIFFLGYVLFELPSNLMLPRVGARKTFSRILVLWGITSACMLFVRDVPTFYLMRFLLGVFEAGFAPGMIYYLSCWYGPTRMARAIAVSDRAPIGSHRRKALPLCSAGGHRGGSAPGVSVCRRAPDGIAGAADRGHHHDFHGLYRVLGHALRTHQGRSRGGRHRLHQHHRPVRWLLGARGHWVGQNGHRQYEPGHRCRWLRVTLRGNGHHAQPIAIG